MNEITDEQLRELAVYSGEPWTPDSRYFPDAEASMEQLWRQMVLPFIEGSDFSHTIDLAAGHGRNSAILCTLADRLTIMDIQPGNIEVCKKRLAGRKGIEFYVNNGFDLRPVRDGEVTLVYCFDAMVHFDSDVVRSYLRDTLRVLTPGGRGFFHHSNFTRGHDWRTNTGGRAFMSKELFEHYALKEGLNVLSQEVITWSGETDIDCLTLVERSR